jgi:hypothetical protein
VKRFHLIAGEVKILAKDVREGDLLDLEGDSVADPIRHADPQAFVPPDDHAGMFEFEFARVDDVEREGSTRIVIHTNQGSWAFPLDHWIDAAGEQREE